MSRELYLKLWEHRHDPKKLFLQLHPDKLSADVQDAKELDAKHKYDFQCIHSANRDLIKTYGKDWHTKLTFEQFHQFFRIPDVASLNHKRNRDRQKRKRPTLEKDNWYDPLKDEYVEHIEYVKHAFDFISDMMMFGRKHKLTCKACQIEFTTFSKNKRYCDGLDCKKNRSKRRKV